MDLDKSGFGFQRVRTYLGPSLGWVDELVQPSTHITTGGLYTVQPGDSLLLVDVAAGVTIQLPDVIKWMQQSAGQPATGFDRSITIKDIGGNAANFNIVVLPFGQQSIDNIQQTSIISISREVVRFVPLIDLSGWSLQANVGGGGGGGGGGDVFKAGNNTYTGVNTFQNTVVAPTVPSSDNTQNVATTAYVKSQGYIIGISLAPYALIASPVFTGDPQAPTPGAGDNDTSIATTAFVQSALASFSGGAPASAEYITASANATLTAERVLTNTASITWDFTTPGQARANSSAGGGNVSNSGVPVNGQFARWVTATTIEGIDLSTLYAPILSPTFTGDPKAPTPATSDNDTSIATTAYVKANVAGFQPLDADLTALSALGGTNTIYYRSAPDIWSPITFSGLSFSGGVLTVTAGGGNVSNSGAPTTGQVARWTDATHIEGVSLAAAGIQPLDGDLTSLAAASATNAIYFRSAADTWGPITISTGLTFTGGALSSLAISDTAPPTPTNGSFWWESDTGTLWMSYNDGTSTQWVAVGGGTSVIATAGPPQGRLTIGTVPVMTTTVAGMTSVQYVPYVGDKIPIYDGTNWTMTVIPGGLIACATTDTAKNPAAIGVSKVNDWFVWNDAGTIRLGHGPDWTSDIARSAGTALASVNGFWVNSVSITNGPAASRGTYVGTTRSNASSQMDFILGSIAANGGQAWIGIWNCYNRVSIRTLTADSTATWTYASTAFRMSNNSATWRASFVSGLQEDMWKAYFAGSVFNSTSGWAQRGIGLNSITVNSAYVSEGSAANQLAFTAAQLSGSSLGFNFLQALEASSAGSSSFYGNNASRQQSWLEFDWRY